MNKQELDNLREDLNYVKTAVDRYSDVPMPWHSRIIWSFYSLIGFALLDFMPAIGGWFMPIGLGICILLEGIFTWTRGQTKGQRPSGQEIHDFLQIMGFGVVAVVLYILAFRGHIGGEYSLGQLFLVVLGYHFFTIGIWSSIKFSWNAAMFLGVSLWIGAVLISFVPHGVWTGLGTLIAVIVVLGFKLPMTLHHKPSKEN